MKAVGVLIIGLGLIMIVVGIQGTQHKILTDMKGLNPKLRAATGTTNATTTESTAKRAGSNPGGTTLV